MIAISDSHTLTTGGDSQVKQSVSRGALELHLVCRAIKSIEITLSYVLCQKTVRKMYLRVIFVTVTHFQFKRAVGKSSSPV